MRILSCIQDNMLGGKMMRWKKIVLFSITFASILVCSCENITILASFGTGLQFQPVERLLVSAGLLFAPSNDTVELSTIGDVLSNANLRLGLIWKD